MVIIHNRQCYIGMAQGVSRIYSHLSIAAAVTGISNIDGINLRWWRAASAAGPKGRNGPLLLGVEEIIEGHHAEGDGWIAPVSALIIFRLAVFAISTATLKGALAIAGTARPKFTGEEIEGSSAGSSGVLSIPARPCCRLGMIGGGLMTGKTGAVILDRPAIVMLVRAVTLAAGQLS